MARRPRARPNQDSLGRPLASSPEALGNFWRWFGDSKAIDEDGRPLVLYHGTLAPNDFDTFDYGFSYDEETGTTRAWSRDPSAALGPHFTEDSFVAAQIAGLRPAGSIRWLLGRYGQPHGRVIPVYLRANKPKRFASEERLLAALLKGHSNTLDDHAEAYGSKSKKQALHSMMQHPDEGEVDDMASVADELAFDLRSKLELTVYDSITYDNEVEGGGLSWIVFDQTQIKSAIGNSGAFSPSDPSILNPRRQGARYAR